MPEILLEAGPGGYLAVLLTVMGLGLAAFAAVSPPVRALVIAGFVLACGVATMLVGVTTTVMARSDTFKAMAHVDPADRETIQRAGEAEALSGAKLGVGGGLPVFAFGLGLIALQFSKRKALS